MESKVQSGDPESVGRTAAACMTAETAHYIHGMLKGLYGMTTQPDAKALRSIIWLAKMEAQRLIHAEKPSPGS